MIKTISNNGGVYYGDTLKYEVYLKLFRNKKIVFSFLPERIVRVELITFSQYKLETSE
jgi:hypothetical protein